MSDIINLIKDWPVIIQGALGSALFWFILLVFQNAIPRVADYLSHYSKQGRISWLVSQETKYEAGLSEDTVIETYSVTILLLRCLRLFFKALMWLAMGLICQNVMYPLGVIGFIGCIYYLLRAYEVVSPLPLDDEKWEEHLSKIRIELNGLGEEGYEDYKPEN